MFAIVDCNNFYASCERLFNPSLANKPIVVLSNNDGCVIARSNEAKALGIKMGEPFFKLKAMIYKYDLKVFSSNYALYGDLSNRVMTILKDSWPESQVYSIDEAFLNLSKLPFDKIMSFCDQLQKKVYMYTGIPVSIGIGETKTLSKLANKIAKTEINLPVYLLRKNDVFLKKIPVGDVWGVGRQWAIKLNRLGILTASDLQNAELTFIKNKFSVILQRTASELKGNNCIEIEEGKLKKSIVSSKSFGSMQTEQGAIIEALSTYCSRAAEKLRSQKSLVGYIRVFIYSNRFREDLPQYTNSIGFKLINATDDTRKIIKCARYCLNKIFKDGYQYKKVGVSLDDLSSKNNQQLDLFAIESDNSIDSSSKVMTVLDSINNRFGQNSLRLASDGTNKKWVMRKDYSSPCYTTRWSDIPKAK